VEPGQYRRLVRQQALKGRGRRKLRDAQNYGSTLDQVVGKKGRLLLPLFKQSRSAVPIGEWAITCR
jgi:hypothetical protein